MTDWEEGVCAEPSERSVEKQPYCCTRSEGHDGKHKATVPSGEVVAEWENDDE